MDNRDLNDSTDGRLERAKDYALGKHDSHPSVADQVGEGVGGIGGMLAGAAIGLLITATFAVVDNVWLDIVARQRPKVEGFAQSNAASMRRLAAPCHVPATAPSPAETAA